MRSGLRHLLPGACRVWPRRGQGRGNHPGGICTCVSLSEYLWTWDILWYSLPAIWVIEAGGGHSYMQDRKCLSALCNLYCLEVWWPGKDQSKGIISCFYPCFFLLSDWIYSYCVWQVTDFPSNSILELALRWRLHCLLNWAGTFRLWNHTILLWHRSQIPTLDLFTFFFSLRLHYIFYFLSLSLSTSDT